MWDDVRAYYLVGSKNPAAKDNNAMPALLWHAAKHSKGLGKISLDFEGSMVPGVERFFRNFGAERHLYPTLVRERSALWKMAKTIKRFV
jgi:lipid II:glycine glycyltransferase (peptidoglycan interpeptide bridge formation enzyme)